MEYPPVLLGRFNLALVNKTSTQYGRTPRPTAILGPFLSIGEKSGLQSLSRFCFAWWMVGNPSLIGLWKGCPSSRSDPERTSRIVGKRCAGPDRIWPQDED